MNQNKRWYRWLKQATTRQRRVLKHVYSDGRQLWASNGYTLHAQPVALGKEGSVLLDEQEQFVIDERNPLPPAFTEAIPQAEAKLTLLVDRDRLLRGLRGQGPLVRLSVYARKGCLLELSSADAYALMAATTEEEGGRFWRPASEGAQPAPNGADGAKTSTLTETPKER